MNYLKNKLFHLTSFLPKPIKHVLYRIKESEIGSKIANGAFWSILGSVISQGLILFASIFIARILGKSTYGEFSIIRSTLSMFAVFGGLGIGMTATKYVAEFKSKDKQKAGRIIGLSSLISIFVGFIIAISILFLSPFISEKTINAPHLTNELRISSFILLFITINGSQTGILAGYESFKSIARISLISGIITFPVQIVFTLLFGLTGAIWGYGFNYIILWFLNYRAVRSVSRKYKIKIDYKNSWQEHQVLINFSLPTVLSGLLVSPVMWISNAILVNQPKGYEELAIFDIGNQWRNIILFIPAALGKIVLPLFSSSNNEINKFNIILKINIILNFIISLFFAVIISLFSSLIITAYGNDFYNGQSVIIILALSSVLISVNNVIGQSIAGIGKMWIGLFFNFIWAIFLIGFQLLFQSYNMGAIGMSLAYFISYLVLTFIQYFYIKNNHK